MVLVHLAVIADRGVRASAREGSWVGRPRRGWAHRSATRVLPPPQWRRRRTLR